MLINSVCVSIQTKLRIIWEAVKRGKCIGRLGNVFATTTTGSIRGRGIVANIGGSCSAITSLLSSNDRHYQ